MSAPPKCFHVPPRHSCCFSEAFLRLSPETPDTPGKADSHEKYLPALPGSGGIPAIPPDGLFSHMCQRLFLASRAAAAAGTPRLFKDRHNRDVGGGKEVPQVQREHLRKHLGSPAAA